MEDQSAATVHWRIDAWFPNLSKEVLEKMK